MGDRADSGGRAPEEFTYLDRETSWLSFGARVLQEAADPRVPLLERLFFLGIFSSNLDEYFRVRVASLRSLLRLGDTDVEQLGINPHRLLHDIHRIVMGQQERYGQIIGEVFDALAAEGIRRVDETSVDPTHHDFLRQTFEDTLRDRLKPIPLDSEDGPPFLKNHRIYLVVELWARRSDSIESWTPTYALVEVPADLPRFVTLPASGDGHEVIYLDDVIRFNLDRLFPAHDVGRSYAVKLTRDAELYVEDEFTDDLVEAIRRSLDKRETGVPSRFLYDMRAPYVLIHRIQHGLGLKEEDFVLGARYHNLSDYMGFPRFGRTDLAYPEWPEVPHPVFDRTDSVLAAVSERDQVLHTPYQSFGHFVRFIEEAAVDPDVTEVWMTVYRVARDSDVLNALIEAAAQGKKVTVFMEVQARFDEESNLSWADRLEAAGVRTLYSMKGLKVHSKIAMVVRKEGDRQVRYGYVGTGNFNEKTAKIYADHGIFTCDPRITDDLAQVFRFLAGEIEEPTVEHLLVAPFTLRKRLGKLIAHEGKRAEEGRPAGIAVKLNALEDRKIIERLYRASRAGVPIDLLVRGICRAIPGVPGQSETIRIRSILDRYLEHARIYRFHHDGEDRMYLASADWMKRNLSKRVEVAIPIYDPEVKREMTDFLALQFGDDTKARWIDEAGENPYVEATSSDGPRVSAQRDFRKYLVDLWERGEPQ